MTNKKVSILLQEIEEDGRNVTSEHIEAIKFAIKVVDNYKPICPVDFPTEEDPYPVCSCRSQLGEWIIVDDVYCECPFCKNKEVKFSKYCPECGAILKAVKNLHK